MLQAKQKAWGPALAPVPLQTSLGWSPIGAPAALPFRYAGSCCQVGRASGMLPASRLPDADWTCPGSLTGAGCKCFIDVTINAIHSIVHVSHVFKCFHYPPPQLHNPLVRWRFFSDETVARTGDEVAQHTAGEGTQLWPLSLEFCTRPVLLF